MKTVRAQFIRWALPLLTVCISFAVPACVSSSPKYALPTQSGEPVIILNHTGSHGQPLLRFTNDGRVLTRAGAAKIDSEDLQDLLFFVLSTERFFDIDTDAVKLAIHQQNSQRGSALAVFNAPTTVLELRLRDRSHRVEVHALEFQAASHANIPSLQRLVAIQRRLIQVSGIALLGGQKKLDRVADRASAELQRKYPDRTRFTADELVGVGSRQNDGALVVHFRRDESVTVLSYVVVVVPKSGEPSARLIER